MRKSLALLTLVLLGACGPAPQPAGEPPLLLTPLTLEPPPISSLFGYRERLSLTSQQITALDSVASWVREADRPVVAQLEEAGYDPLAGPRGGRFSADDSTRALVDRIQQNHRRASEQVQEILTTEQEQEVCRLNQSERERRAISEGRRGPDRRRGMGRDTMAFGSFRGGGRGWSWCARPGAARDSARRDTIRR